MIALQSNQNTFFLPYFRDARLLFCFLILALASSCSKSSTHLEDYALKLYEPQYASGFEILGSDELKSSIIVTKTPWQGADSLSSTTLFISRNGETAPQGFRGQVLYNDAQRIVCMSSSHIAMLDAIGDAQKVVGVSGIGFVNNKTIQDNQDKIGDIGYGGNVDYELLISLDPDIVLLYGVSGASTMESKLNELGIPYIYISEYLEEDPLGKAEWLVAVNELTGHRKEAIECFEKIPVKYNALKELVEKEGNSHDSQKPKIMLNTPYQDSWVMPSTESYAIRLIRDAGGHYIYDKNTGNTSMPIDLEEAYQLVSQADIWLNPGQAKSLNELKALCPKFVDTKCFINGDVWNCIQRTTPAGGNDYWESGVAHPDLILQDLIMIFHPQLLQGTPSEDGQKDCEMPNYEFNYYKKLQ